jgi:hypothetical protein
MAGRSLLLCLAVILSLISCEAEKPQAPKKPTPVVIVKQKPPLLGQDQRVELGFPPEIMAQIELAAGAEAEPFFTTIVIPSENLKGEKGIEKDRLAGFSVRTKDADEIISSLRPSLRAKGYLLFRSYKGIGTLPDIITVIKGNNTYDILKIQGTEAANYQLDTKEIIAWLKERQKQASFVITGAGTDWLEARFIKPPTNMQAFARIVRSFAPDVIDPEKGTVDMLAVRIEKTNGFYLKWD